MRAVRWRVSVHAGRARAVVSLIRLLDMTQHGYAACAQVEVGVRLCRFYGIPCYQGFCRVSLPLLPSWHLKSARKLELSTKISLVDQQRIREAGPGNLGLSQGNSLAAFPPMYN